MRVHVAGEQGAAPHRLPELRLRHPIGVHRPRHDEPDGALARGVRPYRRAAYLGLAQVPRHSCDLVRAGFHHREPSARLRGAAAGRARSGAPQLGAHPTGAADARGRRGGSRARQRCHRPSDRPQGAWLSLAVVGPEREHDRSAARPRFPLRLEPDGGRLLALSRAPRRSGRAGQTIRLRRAKRPDRNADQLVARRLSAFRIRSHADRGTARPAVGAHGDGKLARRVPLHAADGRLGRADLHHASLRHRARLPDARARRIAEGFGGRRGGVHDHGGRRGGGASVDVWAVVLRCHRSSPRKRGPRSHSMSFYVYILASRRNGTLYVGMTDDLIRRVWEHRIGAVPTFTRKYGAKMLVWYEQHETRETAFQRERQMKKWNRAWKLQLIERFNPTWKDLAVGLSA